MTSVGEKILSAKFILHLRKAHPISLTQAANQAEKISPKCLSGKHKKEGGMTIGLRKGMGFVVACACLQGCAAVDNVMRVQPSAGFTSKLVANGVKGNSSGLPYEMVVYAIEFNGKTVHAVPEEEGLGSDLFLTVDISGVLKAGMKTVSADDERKIIRFLIYVSDHNATVWMNRIYGMNKARHGLVGGLKDLTTAGSGISAFISPPAAAGLGVASLLIGGASNEIDDYIYSGKTIEVLFKGIQAARAVQYKEIDRKLSQGGDNLSSSYDIYTALGDVKLYDSLVSFRKGLEYLSALADATSDNVKATTTGTTTATGTTTPKDKANQSTTLTAPLPRGP